MLNKNKIYFLVALILVISVFAYGIYYEYQDKELTPQQEKAIHLQKVTLGQEPYQEYANKYIKKDVMNDGG